MQTTKPLIGIWGGTFDPIHLGHINVAKQLYQTLPFQQIQFIPCGTPPHRHKPIADAHDRLAMVKLAVQDYPDFFVNDVEIKKSTACYTIDTLKTLRTAHPDNIFCLILSTESLMTLSTWHQWQKILDYCHLVIVNRPDYQLPLPLAPWAQDLLSAHQTYDAQQLVDTRNGKIFFATIKETPISATLIRQQLACGDIESTTSFIPAAVLAYIKARRLYHCS
jgi:nicotinate-nucleotide adenylyltransferase